jgi:hypothetical protein
LSKMDSWKKINGEGPLFERCIVPYHNKSAG